MTIPSLPWASRRDRSSAPDTRSGSSFIATLLEQLSVSELRDIAHQRGWRLQLTAKQELVRALTDLLSDPTQIARAVISMPGALRPALRAALVAEDGSGLTPPSLARVLNAFRTNGQPPVKAVEAAGYLMELARWGFVIPWRDVPGSQSRYLFPWEMQRRLLPLPGWCSLDTDAPSGDLRLRTQSEVLQRLHAIWDAIAAQEPQPVKVAVPEIAPEHESNGRRTSRNRQTDVESASLAVPASAFLLGEDTTAAIATVTGAVAEEVDLLAHLLFQLDLVRTANGAVVAQRESMARFQQLEPQRRYDALVQAHISVLNWSELDVLLRADPSLTLQRLVHPHFSHDQFRSQLVRMRHLLLRFVAAAGESAWCPMPALSKALHDIWPETGGISSGDDQQWLQKAWWLALDGQGSPTNAGRTETPNLQNALLRTLIEGPLYWLGLADLSYGDGELLAIRLHGLADLLWARYIRSTQGETPEVQCVAFDTENQLVTTCTGVIRPEAYILLGHIAELQEAAPDHLTFRIDVHAVHRAFEDQESLDSLLAAWERWMPIDIPQELLAALTNWWEGYGRVRLYEGLALLELGDDYTLVELEANTPLSRHIVARLSPRLVLIREDIVDTLTAEFRSKGYTPVEERA